MDEPSRHPALNASAIEVAARKTGDRSSLREPSDAARWMSRTDSMPAILLGFWRSARA